MFLFSIIIFVIFSSFILYFIFTTISYSKNYVKVRLKYLYWLFFNKRVILNLSI
jgi:hypothetical protein